MTAAQLMDSNFQNVSLDDTVEHALEIADKFNCSHLPYAVSGSYKGLISKSFLKEKSLNEKLNPEQEDLAACSVNASVHLIRVAAAATNYKTNVIPVVNDSNDYLGCILGVDLIDALARFCGVEEFGALIVLQIEKEKIVVSELNSIIESEGAMLLHYNITPVVGASFWEVTLGIDRKEIYTILATFEQYNYKVLYSSGDEVSDTDLSTNYENLMHYLDI